MNMNPKLKKFVKSSCEHLHLDITKNMRYDRLTRQIMENELTPGSNCLDIGCHEGEMLDLMIELAPLGTHRAFEPIPYLFQLLQTKQTDNIQIFPTALSNKNGRVEFQVVRNAPAYSGIRKREYQVAEPDIETITVETQKLDDLLPSDARIDFAKIDVEGGEYDVLEGGLETFRRNQTLLIFEFGLGASDYYGTDSQQLFDLVTKRIGLKLYTLKSFLKHRVPLDPDTLKKLYLDNSEYYFVAAAA